MKATPQTPTAPHVHSRSYGDIDEFNQSTRGWQVDFRQLDRGPIACDLVQVVAADLMLTRVIFDRRLDQQGVAPSKAITFAVPNPAAPRIVWRSQSVPPGSMIIYQPGSEINGASRPGFEVLTLTISVPLFEAACVGAGRPDLVDAAHTLEIVTPAADALGRFLAAMQRIARHFSLQPGRSDSPRAHADLHGALVSLALVALASGRPSPAGRTNLLRTRVIRRALDVLADSSGEPVTVTALCEAARVSERTLQYAFREHFDVSPKQYLQATRLDGVRKELRRQGPTATIADIANDWGFWHMGQFAKDYRRHFGELPSETIRRN